MAELRKVFADTLARMMDQNTDVVYLEADLGGAIGTTRLFREYPKQAFDLGIMEANMVGVGAGMSIKGKIPFMHSFGTFTSRRCADQTFISGNYNKANIKLVGSDPGITAEANGGTHMPFEDMGIYRSFPEMTILDVAEPYLLEQVLKQMAQQYGVMYIRFPRKEKEGIRVRVVDMFTVKPLDRELVIQCAKETGAIVTAENHNMYGGLGSAVAEVVAEEARVPFARVGVPDCFGEVGDKAFLAQKFGLTPEHIAEKVKKVIAEK